MYLIRTFIVCTFGTGKCKLKISSVQVSRFRSRSIALGSGDKVYYSLQPSNNARICTDLLHLCPVELMHSILQSTVEYGMVVEIQQQSANAPRVILRSPLRIMYACYLWVRIFVYIVYECIFMYVCMWLFVCVCVLVCVSACVSVCVWSTNTRTLRVILILKSLLNN